MISNIQIQLVKETIKIQEVVSEFVDLKKQGGTWKGICPFHDEKSPSFTVRESTNTYKCFGCGEGGDAIEFLMKHERLDFTKAVEWLANRYNIVLDDNKVKEIFQPKFLPKRPAKSGEEPGKKYFVERKNFLPTELRILFARNVISQVDKQAKDNGDGWIKKLEQVCKDYNLFPLESITTIKEEVLPNGEKKLWATEIQSTEHFPIFYYKEGKGEDTWYKIYQPNFVKEEGKGDFRFTYYGKKPNNFLHGEEQILNRYKMDNLDYSDNDDDLDSHGYQVTNVQKPKNPFKLKEIIKCSGGSDALNLAALGYNVLWSNSETDKIPEEKYKKLFAITYAFYQVNDIDYTGIAATHEFALKHLNCRNIMLPESLRDLKDKKGKPCKDVRDFFHHFFPKDFEILMANACPYRFWDETTTYDKEGKIKMVNGEPEKKYSVNPGYIFSFLSSNGFFQYKDTISDEEKFIHVKDYLIEEVTTKDAKNYLNRFLLQRGMPMSLRNVVYKAKINSEDFLGQIDYFNPDFTQHGKDYQHYFFKNGVWKITADKITPLKVGEKGKHIWAKNVINHNVELLPSPFKITKNALDEYDIEIVDQSGIYFQFMIDTCKLHWRADEDGIIERNYETGEKVIRKVKTENEIWEEKQCLINRIFTTGYVLHHYKDDGKPWCVWPMENSVPDAEKSSGRSGKSLWAKMFEHVLPTWTKGARDPKLTERNHFLEGINQHTRLAIFDDANEYFDFHYFYPFFTGKWDINPKTMAEYSLPYKIAPKAIIPSNFPPRGVDESMNARILYTVFSDYYHDGPNERFKEERSPRSKFKMEMPGDFTEEEWNKMLNLFMYCLQFYLSCDKKVHPPTEGVKERSLEAAAGALLINWADAYFADIEGNNRLNTFLVKESVMNAFVKEANPPTKWNANRFKAALEAWCKLRGYVLNPERLRNSGKNIVQRVDWTDNTGKTSNQTKEMIYIETESNSQKHEPKIEQDSTLPY